MDSRHKYILRLEGEYQEPDNKRDIAEYDSPDEAVEAGLFYINQANEFLGDSKSDWMLLESDLKEGKFVAKRDMPDSQPCIYLKSVKLKKRSIEKESHILKELIKLANELDQKGLAKEADALDSIIKESQFAGYSPYGNKPSRPQPRWPGDPGQKAIQESSKRMDAMHKSFKSSGIDWMQNAFSVLGLVPGYGEPFDAINSAIYAVRGKPLESIMSAISVIPVYGDLIGKGSLLLLKAIKANSKAVSFGAKTWTVAGLAGEINKGMEKSDNEIKLVLNYIDSITGEKKGKLYNIYTKRLKDPVNQALAPEKTRSVII